MVTNVTPSITNIQDGAESDPGELTFTITYDVPMNPANTPSLTFPVEDPSSTLTLSGGSWSTSFIYVANYSIVDADQNLFAIDILVSGAVGVDPTTTQTPYSGEDVFDINMGAASVEVSSINRAGIENTNASSVSWTVTFSDNITGLTTSNFSLVQTGITTASLESVTGSNNTWVVTANTGSSEDGTLRLDLENSTGLTPTVSNVPFTGQSYNVIKSVPFLQVVTIFSNNGNPSEAVDGDVITLGIAASEDIQNVSAQILGNTAVIDDLSDGNETTWQATYTVQPTDDAGAAAFTINFQDLGGGDQTPVTATTDGTFVNVITSSAPEILVEGFEGIDILSGDVTPSTTDGTDFGDVIVGQSSTANTFLIENQGDATLNVSDVTSSNTMFSLNVDISAVVPAGSQSFEITFSPTESGVQTSTISISNNDSDENPYTFLVQGQGTSSSSSLPEINIRGVGDADIVSGDDTPSTADGTDFSLVAIGNTSTQTFTVQNTGSADLQVTSIVSSNELFSINSGISSIAAAASGSFEISFTPTQTGIQTTTITISNNDADESSYTFSLSAQGAAPEIAVFGDNNTAITNGSTETNVSAGTDLGNVTIGQSQNQVFTLSNTGDAALTVSSILSSNDQFSVSSEIQTVAAGASEAFTVVFSPSSAGSVQSDITISNNDSDESSFSFRVQGEGTNPPGEITISSEPISGSSLIQGTRDVLIYKMLWEVKANSVLTAGFYIELEGTFNQSDFEGIELLFNKESDNIGASESLGVGSFNPSPGNAPETSYGWLFTETFQSGELIYFYMVVDIDGSAGAGTTFKVTDFTESNFGLGDAVIDLQTDNGSDFTIVETNSNQDSLALVAIYNATIGDEWTNNENWLTGDLDTWFGITLSNGRVTQINIPDNNLTGEVPEDLATISELTSVDLSGNEITRVPRLNTISSLNTLDVSGNRLQFGDIERNVGITTFNYQDQGLFGEAQTEPVLVRIGGDFILRLPIEGARNNYSWSRRNANGTFEVSTTPNVNITNIDFENMGEFTLTVTSDSVTDLTLVGQPQEVFATAILSGNVTGINDAPLDVGVMDALNIPFDGGAYDSLDQVDVSNGVFSFGELILGDYVCATRGDETIYLPTYFGNTDLWTEADTIFLRNDLVIGDYVMQQLPGETEGPAEVGLLVESDFAEERSASARIVARRKLQKVGCSLRRRRRATGGRPQNDEFELVAYKETDENGEVQFENLPADTYRLNIEYPGIPMDPDSFIEFEVGEEGTDNNSLSLAATVDEEGITVELVEALGFYQPEFNNLRVYPNPTAEYVALRFAEVNDQNMRVVVSDIEGKALKVVPLEIIANEARVDLSGLKEGVYLLQVVGEKKPNRAVFRIIIRQ